MHSPKAKKKNLTKQKLPNPPSKIKWSIPYHIANKRFQFLRVVSRWQQDSKLRLYDIQFKLLEFIYIASQQITTTYLTCLNQSTASMIAFFSGFLKNPFFSFERVLLRYTTFGSIDHLEQQRHDSLYFFLSVVRGMNLKVLKCCQVVRYGPFDV